VSLIAIAKGAQIAAAVSSVVLARRRTEHVPAAAALVVLTMIGLARGPLNAALPPMATPRQGAALVLIYLDGAAEMGTYATIAGLALAVAMGAQHRWRALAFAVTGWAVSSVILGALYPSPLVRGESLQRVYFAADMIGLFVSAAALVRWAQHNIAAKRSPDMTSFVAMSLVALDGAILLAPFSPWRGFLYGSDFTGIQLIITIFFAIFAIFQVLAWIRSTRSDG
jgi:hypothetical protein